MSPFAARDGEPSHPLSSAFQDIDVSRGDTHRTGRLRYTRSVWIGGYSSQQDNTTLTIDLKSWSRTVLRSFTIGPITEADRTPVRGATWGSSHIQKTSVKDLILSFLFGPAPIARHLPYCAETSNR